MEVMPDMRRELVVLADMDTDPDPNRAIPMVIDTVMAREATGKVLRLSTYISTLLSSI